MTPSLRFLRRVSYRPNGQANPFSGLAQTALRAELVVTIYYAASIYIMARMLYGTHNLAAKTSSWDLVWPIAWAKNMNMDLVTELLALAALLSALLALQFKHILLVRVIFAFLLLQLASLTASTGGINHALHAWIWVGFVFAFLPSGRVEAMRRADKMAYLTVFVTAQVLFMLFYTMAGLWKVGLGILSLIAGMPGNFSFEALSWTLADRTLQTDTSPLLADFFIMNPWVAWPAYIAVMYVQLVAVLAAVRPKLHLIWGYALIAFHIGTFVLMEIVFTEHILLLVLLFVLSPLAPARLNVWEAARDFPFIGRLLRLLLPERKPAKQAA